MKIGAITIILSLCTAVFVKAQSIAEPSEKALNKICQQLQCIPAKIYQEGIGTVRSYIWITEGQAKIARLARESGSPYFDSLTLESVQNTKKELDELMSDTASYNNAKWLYYKHQTDNGQRECVICFTFDFTEYGIYKDLKPHGALVVRSLSPNVCKLVLDSMDTASKPYYFDLNNLYSEDGSLMVNNKLYISKEALKTLKYIQLGNYYLPLIYQQLCYPPEAREKEIEGLVIVKISREKILEQVQVKKKRRQSAWTGKCTDLNVEVVQSPHELLSQAVLDAFRQIPNDEFCPFPECYIPIQFVLEKELPMVDLKYGQTIVIRKNMAKVRLIVSEWATTKWNWWGTQ